jgi:hypothetical protein
MEEIELNEKGQHGRGAKRSKERRTKRLRYAKLSAPHPNRRPMTNKANTQVQEERIGFPAVAQEWCP